MDKKSQGYKMFKRNMNFKNCNNLSDEIYEINKEYYDTLANMENLILSTYSFFCENDNPMQKLEYTFKQLYSYIIENNKTFFIFYKDDFVGNPEYDSCMFMALCIFIHHTKKIKCDSLKNFVYNHSNMGYKDRKSPNYYNRKFNRDTDNIKSEESTFRKRRNRILSERDVYHKNDKWHAMREDSEYEWSLYYELIEYDSKAVEVYGEELIDTYKRISNLYGQINKAINANQDENYNKNIIEQYKKLCSKIKKVKYENYIKLNELIFYRLQMDKTFYGINLYRLERELQFYKITSDVNKLLNVSEFEQIEIINKSIIMKDITFPRLYSLYGSFSPDKTLKYSAVFTLLLNYFVNSCILLLDSLIEKNFFGENWKSLFLEVINQMVGRVIYNHYEMDFTIRPGAQEKFEALLLSQVKYKIKEKTGIFVE